jgi:hypothetical protein
MVVATIPVVGGARGVAVAGDRLLVAAGSGGLRILDLKDPEMSELGFVVVPTGAVAVAARGDRAFVACDGAGAQLAVVDISHPAQPVLRALVSHAPERRDLRASGMVDLAISGNLVVASTQLDDQDGKPVKGLLTVSAVKPDSTFTRVVRANLPRAAHVFTAAGGAVALFHDSGVAAFSLPRLMILNTSPADGAEQVALSSPELAIDLEFSTPPSQASLTQSSIVLREKDSAIGPIVSTTAMVTGRHVTVTPAHPLDLATAYYLTIETSVATEDGVALAEKYVTRFRTRMADGGLPLVLDVTPGSGNG